MAQFGSINLLRTQATLSTEELGLLAKIKTLSLLAIAVFSIAAAIVGGLYIYGSMALRALDDEQTKLTQELAANAKKEVYLVAVKNRLPIIEQVMKNQYNWDGVINTVGQIVQPPALTLLAVDSNNTLTLNLSVKSLEDANAIVEKTIEMGLSNKLRGAKISSLQVLQDGHVEATLKFTPTL